MSIVQLRRVSGAADGFALLAAILVIVVVSILSLTGLYIAQNDAAGNSVLRQSMKARYAADAGATQVLVNWDADLYGALDPGDSIDTGGPTIRCANSGVGTKPVNGSRRAPMIDIMAGKVGSGGLSGPRRTSYHLNGRRLTPLGQVLSSIAPVPFGRRAGRRVPKFCDCAGGGACS